MKIAAYQFQVTGNIDENFSHIKKGIEEAAGYGAELLLFPECAVTGYPPRCVKSAAGVDFAAANHVHGQIALLSRKHRMHIVAGTILNGDGGQYNCAVLFRPDGERAVYRKRALWGWDRDNFRKGQDGGAVTEIGPFRVGVRICFEIRFPEYFRELYKERADLAATLFYDDSDKDDPDRYRMIKGHIQTRAVENVCFVISCNTCSPFQTAPTALFDRSGRILAEMERGKEGLLVYDLEKTPLNFGETGRKEISDSLVK